MNQEKKEKAEELKIEGVVYEPQIPECKDSEIQKALENLGKRSSLIGFCEALETFLVYLGNILSHPTDARFRKIRVTNQNYLDRLGNYPGGKELLLVIGFDHEGEQFLTLDEVKDSKKLEAIYTDVQKCLRLNQAYYDGVPREGMEYKWISGKFPKYLLVRHCEEASDIGRRPFMEDEYVCIDKFNNEESAGYFSVLDGHGGRDAVDMAAQTLHLNFGWLCKQKQLSVLDAMKTAYVLTDKQLLRKKVEVGGTTVVTCLLKQEKTIVDNKEVEKKILYAANVGDSRAVLCRAGKAMRLTLDHKPGDPQENERINRDGGYICKNNRVNGALAVSRALGDHKYKPAISNIPYQQTIEITDEDEFLIIACDGVWDVCTDQDCVDFVLDQLKKNVNAEREEEKHYSAKQVRPILRNVARAVVDLSLRRRSCDNISVMVVYF